VTPEAADYLDKARKNLNAARKIASIGLADDVARKAYCAAFHAAEALIFERTGKIAKTHSGLRSEFARLARGEPQIDRAFLSFLANAYQLKEISDYGIGPRAIITMAEADDAVKNAARFIDCITTLLAEPPPYDMR
jgi:uncharacterized protein (UPF0332 family)